MLFLVGSSVMPYLCIATRRYIIMIITENEKEKVIFSNLFAIDYPKLYEELGEILCKYHRGYGALCHTHDYWVRDYMPVQVEEGLFVKFIYNPDYLQAEKRYITNVDAVIAKNLFVRDYTFIDIPLVVDGGNMVFCKGLDNNGEVHYVVMTEKLLAENAKLERSQIESLIANAFQEPRLNIVWLPWDKEDVFGHTDGIVRYVGTNDEGKPKVLVNLELYDDDIADAMYMALSRHFEVVELHLDSYDELSWAYINSLQTKDFIIIPGIGNAITDAQAVAQYNQLYPKYRGHIHQVQMRDFVLANGGALNCCTWTACDRSKVGAPSVRGGVENGESQQLECINH